MSIHGYDPEITMDSFGDNCPTNWEDIASYLNSIIREYVEELTTVDSDGVATIDEFELRERVDALWESFCAGELNDAPAPLF